MRLRLLLLLLGLCVCDGARAQGFNAFSGRNHPELDWRVAVTEHFEIMVPEHLAGIEAEAAAIAEASYAALSENLGVTFEERLRIYLSDEDEIVNGFATPVGGGYTDIWVHVNDAEGNWTGREKWLRKVLAHELAHLFHFRAVGFRPTPLQQLLGDPLPRFWTEGLAQYETEQWDAQRGDRWLRAAVLDDALSYSDGRSIWNGRLLYAIGNAQVRYFAETYGDTTLARLLAHRKPVLFGLTRVHDFGEAFEEVVDKPYRRFYDDWRRHVNVYYNTLAAQLENPDSLGTEPMRLPGQYYYDIRFAPDTSRLAVLSLTSLRRPIRRLYVVDRARKRTEIVAEGSIAAPVAWSPDGERLAFSRLTRGRHGSLLYDLFLVNADGTGLRRLTHSRRATSPTFAPDGSRLAYVASERGTANVVVRDLATGEERAVTRFEGDVQLLSIRWHPSRPLLALARFTPEGVRDVVVLDVETGAVTAVTSGAADDRDPVWSPDGRSLAFTSLRDDVPNVFVHDLASGDERRVTMLATGARVTDWLPPDSAREAGSLVVFSNVSKGRDAAFRLDAARTVGPVDVELPPAYAAWTTHRPPREVPGRLPPDPSLILERRPYRSWSNISHASSFALPYYDRPGDWGVAGYTVWLEPLGKHLFALLGGFSVPSPREESYFAATYVNNQRYPSLGVSLYRLPGSLRFYGNDLLVEDQLGGDVTALWPLDWGVRPFVTTTVEARLRYVDIEPLDVGDFEAPPGLRAPEAGQQADVRLALTRKLRRPYADNVVHPLDGWGVRLEGTAAAPVLGGDSRFVGGELAAYRILPALGLQRLFLYGRGRARAGTAFAQDFIGLSGRDDVQLELPGTIPITLGDAERVRGYRTFALGDRVLFGTAEYRVPLLSSLQTRLLGLVELGATTLAAFADGGVVWSGSDLDGAVRRLGTGLEVKNALRLGGFLELAHAVGVAQPAADLGDEEVEVYYRVRAAVPF